MARPAEWATRYGDIKLKLGAMAMDAPLGRLDIEAIFGASKSGALRLMERIGPAKGFDCLIVTASAALDFVRFSREGQEAEQEMERKRKLALKLSQAREDQVYRKVDIRAESADEWARLNELPIRFEIGQERRMTLVFTDATDLLHTLWRFTRACQGPDWDVFIRLVESEQKTLPEAS